MVLEVEMDCRAKECALQTLIGGNDMSDARACFVRLTPNGEWMGARFHTWGLYPVEDGPESIAIVELNATGEIQMVSPTFVRFANPY